MGEDITLIYTMTEGYQFAGWNVSLAEGITGTVEIKDGVVYLDDAAVLEVVPNGDDFDEDYYASLNKYQIIYKIIGGSRNLVIKPTYYKKPVIEKVTPENTEAVEKNSSIVITFSKKMDISDKELSKITITVDGVDALDYFETPTLSESTSTEQTQITFLAKKDKLINVSNGTRNVTITIPQSFSYDENGDKVTLSQDYVYTYIINDLTVDKITLDFDKKEDYGKLIPADSVTLYLENEYTVEYVPNNDQLITGWLAYVQGDANKVPVSDTILTRTVSEDNQTLTLKVLAGLSGNIVVTPILAPKTEAKISVDCVYGTGTTTPEGEIAENYSGDTLSLSFKESVDYQFLYWKIDSTDETVKQKFTIENSGKLNAVLKIGNLDDDNHGDYNFTVRAVCQKRPKVISTSPDYDASGVYRDRTVVILFDKIIEESSIYWTKNELKALGIEEPEYTLLSSNKKKAGEDLYYGYYLNTTDEAAKYKSYVYKNISISRVEDEDSNLLRYYGIPVFDSENPRFLRIPVNSESNPPASLNILVTISKNLGTKVDGIDSLIYLSEDTAFSYRTNGSIDKKVPSFARYNAADTEDYKDFYLGWAKEKNGDYELNSTHRSILSAIKNEVTGLWEEPGESEVTNNLKTSSKLKTNNLFEYDDNGDIQKDKSIDLYVYGRIEDAESGPASLQWNIEKIENPFYPKGNGFTAAGQIARFDISGTEAKINERIKLSDLGLIEGAYKITLYAYDVNENIATREYFFIWDNVSPTNVSVKKESHFTSGKSKVEWTSDSVLEKDTKIIISPYKDGNKITDAEITKITDINTSSENLYYEVSYTNDNKPTSYKLQKVDYVGNKSNISELAVDWTPPGQITDYYYGTREKTIDVFFTSPTDDDFIKVDYTTKIFETNSTKSGSGIFTKGEKGKITKSSLTDGTKYEMKFYSVDSSGNKSEPVTITETAGVRVGGIIYEYEDKIFCSDTYQSSLKSAVKGIVCGIPTSNGVKNYSKVRIWHLNDLDVSNYNWGKNDSAISYSTKGVNTYDGLETYNTFLTNTTYYNMTFNYHYTGRLNISGTYTYWSYIQNTIRKNTKIEWYIPGLYEINDIFCGTGNSSNVAAMKATITTLTNDGINAVLQGQDKMIITSSPSSDSAYYHLIKDNSILNYHSTVSYEEKNGTYCYRDCRPASNTRLHLMAQVDLSAD